MGKTFTSASTNRSVADKPTKSTVGEKPTHSKEPALKATFTAVMLLGGFIVASWALVFTLFLSRN